MKVHFHALKVFDWVAELESITRAAEALYISQPAVTKHVRNLEEELGFQLVAMEGRGVRLTAAGEEVAKIARRLRGIEIDMLRFANSYQKGKLGELKLGATYLPANFLLPRKLADFKKENPRVTVRCTTLNAEQALNKLLGYEIDIALIGGRKMVTKGVKQWTIKRDEIWFIVPNEHRLANDRAMLKEMLEEPFVLREEGSSMREMLFSLCRTNGFGPPIVGMEVNGSQETLRMIAAGYGAGFVSAMEAKESVARGEIKRVLVEEAAELHNTITVCVREGERLPPAAAYFYGILQGGRGV